MASLMPMGRGSLLREMSMRSRGQPLRGLGAQSVTACLLENELASYSLSLG